MSRRRTVAMVVNDDAGCLDARGVWTTIATVRRLDMLAPTGCTVVVHNSSANTRSAP